MYSQTSGGARYRAIRIDVGPERIEELSPVNFVVVSKKLDQAGKLSSHFGDRGQGHQDCRFQVEHEVSPTHTQGLVIENVPRRSRLGAGTLQVIPHNPWVVTACVGSQGRPRSALERTRRGGP